MSKHGFLTRFMKYYKKRGFLSTFRRIYEQPKRSIFKGQMLLLYAELSEVDDSVLNLPNNIFIEIKRNYDEAVQTDMQTMINYWRKVVMMDKIKERFEKGAILWIIRMNGHVAGYQWSIRGSMAAAYPLPVTPHDAIFFNAETFEEYRGLGLYPLLTNFMFAKLKAEGVKRVFAFSYAWNTSIIRGIAKNYFNKFSEARNFHVFGQNITIWS